jgi:ArsR family transcriptional regulator
MLKELTLTTKTQENVANSSDNCCTPLYQPQISREQAENAAVLFAALADPTRLSILNMLAASHTEVCVCDITGSFQLGQPTISHHLRILKEAGLVSGDKRGKWVYYSLVQSKAAEVKAMLQKVLE